MGKAQSKRSVDFTTEGKKSPEDELAAGKVEKIEDAEDQKPQVNGDATPQENEKKEAEESENDKDLTTEKSSGEAGGGGGGDEVKQQNGEQAAAAPVEDAATAAGGATTPKEETKDEDAAAGEEAISPLADDSSKKTKKEKGKKKWSFRSISFGKKDKQKPARSDAEAVSPTTNGEAADKPAEGVNEDASEKKEEGAAGDAEPTKATENGEASEKELLNGGGDTTTTTTTPTEEKSVAATTNNDQSINDTAASAAAATATNNTTASSSTTTSPSTAPVAVVETENKIAAEAVAPILSNGNSDAINEKKQPEVVSMPEEKPQQNGTNGEDHGDEEDTETHAAIDDAAAIKAASKAQIESDSKTNEQVFYPTITLSTDETETIIQEGVSDVQTNAAAGDVGKTLASIATIEETVINTPDVGGGGDIVVEKKQTEVNASPPPLPVSPPPSQVMAFALGADSSTIMDEDQKVLAPTISSDLCELHESNVVSVEEKPSIENITPIESVVEEAAKHCLEQQKAESSGIEKVEVAASASFMVDEITAKAVKILDDIQQASSELISGEEADQQQKQIETDMSFENVGANETVECTNEKIEEDSEEELPPPPPSPPSFAAEFEGQEIDIEQIKAMPMSVEEVLHHFDSNVNEIEKKVLNYEMTSNSSMDESNMDDQSTALIEEVEEKEKQESIVALVEEEVRDLTVNEKQATIVLSEEEEEEEEETVIKAIISEITENVSVPDTKEKEFEQIKVEKVTEQEEELIEQAQSEKPEEMKQENTVDVSTMLAAEIDKLTLNELQMQKIVNETTLEPATTQQDSKENVEHELLEKLDDDIEENIAHESAEHNQVESKKEAALHNAANPVKVNTTTTNKYS